LLLNNSSHFCLFRMPLDLFTIFCNKQMSNIRVWPGISFINTFSLYKIYVYIPFKLYVTLLAHFQPKRETSFFESLFWRPICMLWTAKWIKNIFRAVNWCQTRRLLRKTLQQNNVLWSLILTMLVCIKRSSLFSWNCKLRMLNKFNYRSIETLPLRSNIENYPACLDEDLLLIKVIRLNAKNVGRNFHSKKTHFFFEGK